MRPAAFGSVRVSAVPRAGRTQLNTPEWLRDPDLSARPRRALACLRHSNRGQKLRTASTTILLRRCGAPAPLWNAHPKQHGDRSLRWTIHLLLHAIAHELRPSRPDRNLFLGRRPQQETEVLLAFWFWLILPQHARRPRPQTLSSDFRFQIADSR